MASKRFLIVLVDSSAARMPLPGFTMASATLFNAARFMASSFVSRLFYPQGLDPLQGLSFQPFEEGAAGGRDIAEPLDHARMVQGGERVAAAGERVELSLAGEVRDAARERDGSGIEGRKLEGAHRPVPHQGAHASELRQDRFHRFRSDIENHL